MTGPVRWLAAATLLLTTTPLTSAQEPADVVFPFPAKAPIVVHLHGIERTKSRLFTMLDALPPVEAASVKSIIDDGLKSALEKRSLKAFPSDGRVFLVFHDLVRLGEEPPPISILIPVTTYREFRESFLTPAERKTFEAGPNRVDLVKLNFVEGRDEPTYFIDLKSHVALTPDKAIAEEYAGKYVRASTATLGPELSESFLSADVSLYANMAVINESHRDEIRDFRELIEFSLKQAEMNDMLPGLDRRQFEAAKLLVSTLFQGIEDCRGLVLSAEFRPAGLNLRVQTRFGEETPTARLLKAEMPSRLADISQLPGGLGIYTASRLGPKATPFMQLFFNQGVQAAPGDGAGEARIAKLEADLIAAGPGAEFSATGVGSNLTVTHYTDPKKAATAVTELYSGLTPPARLNGVVLKEKPRVTPAAHTHRGFECAEVRFVYDFEATVAILPEVSRGPTLALLRKMNPEKPVFWIGTDGKRVIRLGAIDWPAALKLLEAYLDDKLGLGVESGYQLTRTNLPADATLIALFETRYVITTLLDYYRELAEAVPGGGFPTLGPVKAPAGPPSYIGVALTLKPQTATIDLFVPGTAMNASVRMLVPAFKPIK